MISRQARRIRICAGLLAACTALSGGEGQSSGPRAAQPAQEPAGVSRGLRSALLPQQSAGVFIGVEKFFPDLGLADVTWAVDDAVDLAYALAIERGLLPANRVLLLLAGEPRDGSRDHLQALLDAGAKRQSARLADILSLTEGQSRLVGRAGILVLSISTHGFTQGSDHMLLTEDSLLEYRTGVTAANLLHATGAGGPGLRLLLVDACRTQLLKSRGTPGPPDPRSAMRTSLVEELAQQRGYAVFSAASDDEYAYPENARVSGHGLFTGAILKGLRCREGERVKTLQGLASLVRAETTSQSPGRSQHPQLLTGGGADDFVLLDCAAPTGLTQVRTGLSPSISRETLATIDAAGKLLAVGGPDNVERSLRLYRKALGELPGPALASLNQGLLSRARQLADDSRADEGARTYQQLFEPILAHAGEEPTEKGDES
jgi:hypothetical protein